MAKKEVKTIPLTLPRDKEQIIYSRIDVFLDLYFVSEKDKTRVNHNNFIKGFTLKSLAYSCYLQGLADGEQVLKNL